MYIKLFFLTYLGPIVSVYFLHFLIWRVGQLQVKQCTARKRPSPSGLSCANVLALQSQILMKLYLQKLKTVSNPNVLPGFKRNKAQRCYFIAFLILFENCACLFSTPQIATSLAFVTR